MLVRKTRKSDLPIILEIYEYARQFMRKTGNPNQWGDSYPEEALLIGDIEREESYVIVDEDDYIFGTFLLKGGDDPTYAYIEDGSWPNDKPYKTIHRIASNGEEKGILKACVDFAFTQIDSLRIDTHADNIVMQNAITKVGFERCGIIYVEDGSPRIAYQLELVDYIKEDECVICGAPLEYLENAIEMECEICHKKEKSKTRCISGHYVCNDCHMDGIDSIWGVCLAEKSTNPLIIMEKLMGLPFCHMHGPEHHVMVGAALLTAYKNAGGDIELKSALESMNERGKKVPGGACGFWGCCGSAVSSGIFVSIVTGSTPLKTEEFGSSNLMTSTSLKQIGKIGGPRCCKRGTYLSIAATVKFVKDNLDIKMDLGKIECIHSQKNNQCIGKKCPFNKD